MPLVRVRKRKIMIAFKYTKTDGAEFLSHLDLLRHLDRTFKRAGIKVKTSEGFHPHPKIFMNNPLGLGIKSVAEYCAAECDYIESFKELFNANSPGGIKCLDFKEVDENPNYAFTIDKCGYSAEGIAPFDTEEFLSRKEIIISDKRGREVDIRPRIYTVECKNGTLYFTLGCGQNNLRPDLFCEFLEREYGGTASNLIKISSYGKYTF